MKQIKAWGVQRRCDNVLFDDALRILDKRLGEVYEREPKRDEK